MSDRPLSRVGECEEVANFARHVPNSRSDHQTKASKAGKSWIPSVLRAASLWLLQICEYTGICAVIIAIRPLPIIRVLAVRVLQPLATNALNQHL